MELFGGLIAVTLDVFLQKLHLRNVPALADIGGPAEGCTCIVTGPTSGIGAETAATLVRRNAHVVLACRSAERGEKLRKQLYEEGIKAGRQPSLEVQLLDVASLDSIRRFAKSWHEQKRPLHMLINNAGIFSMGADRSRTEEGFEAHMGTNYLGPFLLTMLLLPNLRQTAKKNNHNKPVRIVNVSSKMHELASGIDKDDPHFEAQHSYSSLAAYNRSKLAQVVFTAELRRRLPGDCGIAVTAVHPGEVMTDVVRSLPALMQSAYRFFMRPFCLSPAEGARSSIYCATSRDPILTERGQLMEPDNCYFGSDCRCSSPSSHALDPALGQWLWKWSADMVKLPVEYDIPAMSAS
ncbi:Retinol dehydrogenase 11 [Coccomyxa sp. Obi]|nr:Retinol dehydrogenase 11 [Coccomyxa sp. Obi]